MKKKNYKYCYQSIESEQINTIKFKITRFIMLYV